jgi:hypothetical protein
VAHLFVPISNYHCSVEFSQDILDLFARLDDSHYVLFNCSYKREADVIVFSKYCVHLFEVKDYSETITVNEKDQWVLDDGKVILNRFSDYYENPIQQADNTAGAFLGSIRAIYGKSPDLKRKIHIFSYVLVPHANQQTQENLRKITNSRNIYLVSSLIRVTSTMQKREDRDSKSNDFYFEEEEIASICKALKMKETENINGCRMNELTGQHFEGNQISSNQSFCNANNQKRVSGKNTDFPDENSVIGQFRKIQSRIIGFTNRRSFLILSLALVCLVLLFAFSGIFLPRGCFTGSSLNVRTSPAGSVAGTVKNGVCFRFNGKSDGWLRIGGINQYRGDWVSSQYFNVDVNRLKEVR